MNLRFIIAGVLLLTLCRAAWAQVPLPSDLSVQPPSADVLPEYAAFSGAWGNGAWYGSIPTALIVERVDEDGTARVIYARGATEYPCAADHESSRSVAQHRRRWSCVIPTCRYVERSGCSIFAES